MYSQLPEIPFIQLWGNATRDVCVTMQVLRNYTPPQNPRFVPNPYVFVLYRQSGRLDPGTFSQFLTNLINDGQLFYQLSVFMDNLDLEGV